MKTSKKLWIGLGMLALLCPLGLIIPDLFKAGSAWGEWDSTEIQKIVGYVPEGLKRFSEIWKAPLPDYSFKGWEGKGLGSLSFAYIFSAILGAGLVALFAWLAGRLLSKKGK
jgi:hypothetical protein